MAIICASLGTIIWRSGNALEEIVAGHVTTFLASICLCLFATASVIILQLLGKFRDRDRWLYPTFGYLVALATISSGIFLFTHSPLPPYFVAGHVIVGLGLICCCISTVALASTQFINIPQNSRRSPNARPLANLPFSKPAEYILLSIPILAAVTCWTWALILLATQTLPPHFIAGHVMAGLAAICTSLIALTWSVIRQTQNKHGNRERIVWPSIVISMGLFCIFWGIGVILYHPASPIWYPPGLVLIGLGLVCFSILSKVALLSLVWRREFPLANRIPMIPVVTALACLFFSVFLFQFSTQDTFSYIPARVIAGLGAICYSLFSIVSILESGTAKK